MKLEDEAKFPEVNPHWILERRVQDDEVSSCCVFISTQQFIRSTDCFSERSAAGAGWLVKKGLRKAVGVRPVEFLKVRHRWAWSAKPQA